MNGKDIIFSILIYMCTCVQQIRIIRKINALPTDYLSIAKILICPITFFWLFFFFYYSMLTPPPLHQFVGKTQAIYRTNSTRIKCLVEKENATQVSKTYHDQLRNKNNNDELPNRYSIANWYFLKSKSKDAIKFCNQECDTWFSGGFYEILNRLYILLVHKILKLTYTGLDKKFRSNHKF